MQSFAFVAPLPLRTSPSCRETSEPSDAVTHLTCVAKPPSRTPQSNKVPRTSKRKNGDNAIPRNPRSRPTEELTAAQLSEKLSKAVGFDLILDDITRLTRVLRSFVKPKSLNRNQPRSNKDSDSDLILETSLTVPTQSSTYKPKSTTGAKIATTYTAARGAIDRAFQSLSIKAQFYVNTVTQVAGDTVYKILSIGHEAFPALGLDKAKDAVTGVLKGGWTPLSVFQWQLSAAPSENLDDRRQARIQQIASFFRGGAIDFVSGTGSALAGLGKAAEKLAPLMAKGVGKAATFGYVERTYARKLPKQVSGKIFREPQKQKSRLKLGKDGPHLSKDTAKTSITQEVHVAPKFLGALEIPYAEVASFVNTWEDSSSIPIITPTTPEIYIRSESEYDAESDNHTVSATAKQEKGDSDNAQNRNAQFLRNGAIVLAAGAVATAAASVSVPTAITCSTLMVASMALSGAKAANASDLQIQAGHRVRQSRSIQNLEGILARASMRLNIKPKVPTALLTPAIENTRILNDEKLKITNSITTSTRTVEMPHSDSIEASAYAVSASQPQIMSLPMVGFLLSWLDVMAYHVEGLVATVIRRSGLWYPRSKETAEWKLLRSFQRLTRPD